MLFRSAQRRGVLHHKSRGTIVAGVHPRSDAALCCAGFKAGKTRKIPAKAPPWPGIKRLGAPGRVRPPPWEDALTPYQDAERRGILHHKPRDTIVAGVPPRSDATLCCAGLRAGKTRKIPAKAPPLARNQAPWRAGPRPTSPREDALAPSQDAGRQIYRSEEHTSELQSPC